MNNNPVCPHPIETLAREKGMSSYTCPVCRGRVCLDCRRYGSRGSDLPLVSWMTGRCDDCEEVRRERSRTVHEFEKLVSARARASAIWAEGRAAGPDSDNPYDAPSEQELWLLEQHPWLRDGGAS